jgi:hypothetical protein
MYLEWAVGIGNSYYSVVASVENIGSERLTLILLLFAVR